MKTQRTPWRVDIQEINMKIKDDQKANSCNKYKYPLLFPFLFKKKREKNKIESLEKENNLHPINSYATNVETTITKLNEKTSQEKHVIEMFQTNSNPPKSNNKTHLKEMDELMNHKKEKYKKETTLTSNINKSPRKLCGKPRKLCGKWAISSQKLIIEVHSLSRDYKQQPRMST